MEEVTSTGSPVTPPTPVMPTPESPKPVFDQKDIEENKIVAAIGYLWILFLVPLLLKKESPFAQFHAKQGLVLCIAALVFSIIPVLGWLANLVLLVVAIMAIIKTLSGEAWEIPYVKDMVKKINI